MQTELSPAAQMIELYESSVYVNNAHRILAVALQDTSCIANSSIYLALTMAMAPALQSNQHSPKFQHRINSQDTQAHGNTNA
jgi:hypothetical protein